MTNAKKEFNEEQQITSWAKAKEVFICKSGKKKTYEKSYNEIAEQINKNPWFKARVVWVNKQIAVFSKRRTLESYFNLKSA